MNVSDFYNAVTPGSSLTHGVGRGVYTIIDEKDICSAQTYEDGKLPINEENHHSVFNEVNKISEMHEDGKLPIQEENHRSRSVLNQVNEKYSSVVSCNCYLTVDIFRYYHLELFFFIL